MQSSRFERSLSERKRDSERIKFLQNLAVEAAREETRILKRLIEEFLFSDAECEDLHNEEKKEKDERAELANRGVYRGTGIMVDGEMQEFQNNIREKIQEEVGNVMRNVLEKYGAKGIPHAYRKRS